MERNFKRIIASIVTVVIFLTATPLSCFIGLELPDIFSIKAEATAYNGTCGDNLTWTLNTDSGLFEISGTGDMYNWPFNETPWDSYRSSIQTVIIGDGVTTIGESAFYFCENLTSVSFGKNVTTIGKGAFNRCSKLARITIPNNVSIIDDYVFGECLSLTSITIPDSVTTIGKYAFTQCTSLTNITIPESVKYIGDSAFDECSCLEKIAVDSKNEHFSSDDYGVLFNKDKTQLIQYPIGNKRTNYTIPSSVTSIGDCSFHCCKNLKNVTIPDSVTTIGVWAFNGCGNLTSVIIPNSVTSIDVCAFSSCYNLTSVTIPDSVKSIGDNAFIDCKNLTDVYYNGTVEQWNFITNKSDNLTLENAMVYFGEINEEVTVTSEEPDEFRLLWWHWIIVIVIFSCILFLLIILIKYIKKVKSKA